MNADSALWMVIETAPGQPFDPATLRMVAHDQRQGSRRRLYPVVRRIITGLDRGHTVAWSRWPTARAALRHLLPAPRKLRVLLPGSAGSVQVGGPAARWITAVSAASNVY